MESALRKRTEGQFYANQKAQGLAKYLWINSIYSYINIKWNFRFFDISIVTYNKFMKFIFLNFVLIYEKREISNDYDVTFTLDISHVCRSTLLIHIISFVILNIVTVTQSFSRRRQMIRGYHSFKIYHIKT